MLCVQKENRTFLQKTSPKLQFGKIAENLYKKKNWTEFFTQRSVYFAQKHLSIKEKFFPATATDVINSFML